MGTLKEIELFMDDMGIPGKDPVFPSVSTKTFPGGQGVLHEVVGIESVDELLDVLENAALSEIAIKRAYVRCTEQLLSEGDKLHQFTNVARREGLTLIADIIFPACESTPLKSLVGADQITAFISKVMSCVKVGFTGVVVHDFGVLTILGEMKSLGDLPATTYLVFSGKNSNCYNSAQALVLETLGADSLDLDGSLALQILYGMRACLNIPFGVAMKSLLEIARGNIDIVSNTIAALTPVYLQHDGSKSSRLSNREQIEQAYDWEMLKELNQLVFDNSDKTRCRDAG